MAASAAGRHVAGTALAENRKERNMTGNTNAGTAGEDRRNERPGWIEERPGKDTAEAREGIARLAGPMGTMAEEWEDDGSPFLATVRKSPLFYRVPETNRHRLYDDRFADGLARAVGAEKAEVALRGTLWRLGRADRRLCKAWREVWFLKRFRVEDDGSLRSAFASADRNAFVVVGGGDAASLPAWLHNRAFPLAVVARFCEDGVVRFSARAFGSRRPGNAPAAQEEKHMRLALALERIRQRLVGIARTESWDGVVAAAGEVTYRLAAEESGLPVESIRNLLHRKDADGLPLHKALAFLWQQCRDPEAILCAADRRRTPSETKRRREATAAAEARRTENSVGAVLVEERDRLWNHGDRGTVRKARIASAV